MRTLCTVLVLAALLCVAGCTSFRVVDPAASAPAGEAIFVLGVQPANYRVMVFPGTVKDGVFRQSVVRMSAYYGAAKDGYVVGKAKPGDTLAITRVRQVANESDILGRDFVPCRGMKTMVFKVPKAGVYYLGNVSYATSGNKLEVRYSDNIDTAQAYIASHYPNLALPLGRVQYELLPAQQACRMDIMIPIYVGR